MRDGVCPKKKGGLGVLNLQTQNEALLLKYMHKFFNRVDLPWVHLIWKKHYRNGKLPNHIRKGSFWLRDILKLLDKLKGMATVSRLGDGKTCYLWSDLWEGQVPSQTFPELCFFAKNKSLSIHVVKQMVQLEQMFHLPLSPKAYDQLNGFLVKIENTANSDDQDVWSYIWGKSLFLHLKLINT